MIVGVVIILCACWVTSGQEYVSGSCPEVKAMQDFNMTKFLGGWYVQELFESYVKCLRFDITQDGSNPVWIIDESRKSGFLHKINLGDTGLSQGTLVQKDGTSGKFIVNWNTNIGGGYDLIVVYTDYTNLAVVFSCQELLIGHRQAPYIMSRDPFVKTRYRQEGRATLVPFDIEMSYFQKVTQSNCYPSQDTGPLINYGPHQLES